MSDHASSYAQFMIAQRSWVAQAVPTQRGRLGVDARKGNSKDKDEGLEPDIAHPRRRWWTAWSSDQRILQVLVPVSVPRRPCQNCQ